MDNSIPEIEHSSVKTYPRSEHGISRRNIDPDALKIMYRLIRNGHKAYLVGGGVRDLLLGKKPKDFDIGTDATPRKVKSLFNNCRIIGRRFKLAHIFFGSGKIIEVATFRDTNAPIEGEESMPVDQLLITRDNRFGTEQTDAVRRDLTINGLFYDPSSFSVIDYVGGMEDIKTQTVRVIGNPDLRFAEDPVRLSRVIRHAVRAGFEIEPDCWRSIVKNNQLILQASPVRLFEELKKDFSSGYCLGILRLLAKAELLKHLLPELCLGEPNLLSPGHDFGSCIEELDALVQEGREMSPSVVLCLMALFMHGQEYNCQTIAQRFPSKTELSEHLRNCFSHFSVPRKEREKIEDILRIWHQLNHTRLDQVKLSELSRRPFLKELEQLVMCFPETPTNRDILDLIGVAKDHDPGHESHSRPRQKKRYPNKGRYHGRRKMF